MEWTKTTHCSWGSSEGHRIVKMNKPCKGGIVYVYMNGSVIEYAASLEQAMQEIEDLHGEQAGKGNGS